ncbi:hypothetical protein GCM10027597_00300 [Saccharopolyspora tripterygii]
MQSGLRPIQPQVRRAHWAIASRSLIRSADDVGVLKNGIVMPPLPVSVGTVRVSTCGPVCIAS